MYAIESLKSEEEEGCTQADEYQTSIKPVRLLCES